MYEYWYMQKKCKHGDSAKLCSTCTGRLIVHKNLKIFMQTLKEMVRQDSVNKKNEAEKNYELGKIRP